MNLPAKSLWEALSRMNHWLTDLETVSGIRKIGAGEFFVQGREYEVDTPEGVTIHACLTNIDEEQLRVVIDAQVGPLRSHLTCQVIPEGDTACRLLRTQQYPGLIGWAFTAFKGKREAAETAAYLKAWIANAESHTGLNGPETSQNNGK